MEQWNRTDFLSCIVSCFFLASAIGCVVADGASTERYAVWGHSPDLGLAVGFFHLSAAIMLALRGYRFAGALLGGVVMLVSASILAMDGEFAHAVGPLVVLAACVVLGLAAVERAMDGA